MKDTAGAQSRLSFFVAALCVGLVSVGVYFFAANWVSPLSSTSFERVEIQEADSIFQGATFEIIHPRPGFALKGDFIVAYINVSLSKLTPSTVLRLTLQKVGNSMRDVRLVPLDLAKAASLGPQGEYVIIGQRLALQHKPSDYILSAAVASSISSSASVLIEAKPTRFSVLADDSSDWAVLAAWVQGNQATWHFEIGNIVAPTGETYRGALATEELPAGAVVCDVPNTISVHYSTVIRTPFMRWIDEKLLEGKNDWVIFPAYLAWCSKYAEHCPHAPFVRYLPSPDTIPYLPLWWTPSECALFEGTSVAHEIAHFQNNRLELVEQVLELLQSNEELGAAIDRYLVEYSVVATATRCWGTQEEGRLRLCPLLDLLNHHSTATQLNSEKAEHSRSVTAKALKVGDEVWLNYGADKSANSKVQTPFGCLFFFSFRNFVSLAHACAALAVWLARSRRGGEDLPSGQPASR